MIARVDRRLVVLSLIACPLWCADTIIWDRTHHSAVFHETRHYRIFLPADYESSEKRYPVIYWFHGYGERYNKGIVGKEYDRGSDYKGDNLANFVAGHDVIIVKVDGANPRSPNEDYPHPYNIGPVETYRQFPLYFLEFIGYIDDTYRTIPDREHRATSGFSMGGFMSFWIAGKYPDLVSSASSFMGSPEFVVGPRAFPVEYSHDQMAENYNGVRTRLVTGSQDFMRFYHRKMNLLWRIPAHETEDFEFDHGTPGIAKTLAFHMNAFANPLPLPEIWNHTDVYPIFRVWDWTVTSDRRQPGFTSLRDVASDGFRSEVREWVPSGRLLNNVRLNITTARLYPPNQAIEVTIGQTKRQQFADREGRLQFKLDGSANEVTIGSPSFQISDHRTLTVFQHGIKTQPLALGTGNGDGKANPGEEIAILFPHGDAYRAAELFTTDPCADVSYRVSDNWAEYDWAGASAKYTLLKISPSCPTGHIIHLTSKIQIPNKPAHQIQRLKIKLEIVR